MKLRSSLLKRTLVPLLAAVAATPFCAPVRAATATHSVQRRFLL